MHIHSNPINPYAQLDAMQSARKSEANAAAERTRKKLMESSSGLAGEAAEEAYLVEGEPNGDSGEHRRGRQRQRGPRTGDASAESQELDHSVEDWA